MSSEARVIRLKKDKLLEKLNENKKTHKEAYEDASKQWAADMAVASVNLQANPTDDELMHQLSKTYGSKPQEYLEEYDMAIMQMEMEVRTEIELGQAEFNQLVCDKWTWSRSFGSNVYTSASLTKVKGRV